jgi:hypothetical protein
VEASDATDQKDIRENIAMFFCSQMRNWPNPGLAILASSTGQGTFWNSFRCLGYLLENKTSKY